MAIPAEFNYRNEDDFVQRFLIPLLHRLGFSVVVNYHGTQEFGKDLIFAEIDRFGQIRYHGLQAKYATSIGLKDSSGLIDDCDQALANPFRHPHTGATERISTFYAINGGDISEQGGTNFFNRLTRYGGNVRLLDGKALLALDRWAALNRTEAIGETLSGLIIEVKLNKNIIFNSLQAIEDYKLDGNNPLPLERLRGIGVSGYLARPIAPNSINVQTVLKYAVYVDRYRDIIDFCIMSLASFENKKDVLSKIVDDSTNFYLWGNEIEQQATAVLAALGPFSGF